MNILFLTMNNFDNIHEHSLYPDLVRELSSRGHKITVLSPIEKRYGINTNIVEEGLIRSIKVQTGNLFNVGLINKAFSRAGICRKYEKALNVFCKHEKFDLVLYSTPPITLAPIIRKVKKRGAYTYLMLKDIFPQNAVDLGLFGQNSLIYKFFRISERRIYRVSDTIGCMSPANVEYLKKQDPWIDIKKITICPNSIEITNKIFSEDEKRSILLKYGIPDKKMLLVYGGGLGKPQGIDFLIKCIQKASTDPEYFFVVIGSGPYFEKLTELEKLIPNTLKVIKWLPTEEYERIVAACDIGLVMLNHSFKIPNFPSRILLYMQSRLPILAATDPNSDVGKIAEENGFGLWCESNNTSVFLELMSRLKIENIRKQMGDLSYRYLLDNYSVVRTANDIEKTFESSRK